MRLVRFEGKLLLLKRGDEEVYVCSWDVKEEAGRVIRNAIDLEEAEERVADLVRGRCEELRVGDHYELPFIYEVEEDLIRGKALASIRQGRVEWVWLHAGT